MAYMHADKWLHSYTAVTATAVSSAYLYTLRDNLSNLQNCKLAPTNNAQSVFLTSLISRNYSNMYRQSGYRVLWDNSGF